jgi:hypothetical protein
MSLDLDAIADKWLQQCGPCDAGLPMGCSHPDEDYRPVLMDLVNTLAAVEAQLVAERIAIDAREGDWHLGVRAGLARALDIIREVRG